MDSRSDVLIRSTRLREVDFQPPIPYPRYSKVREGCPNSPTMSDMAPPGEPAQLLLIMTEEPEPFQIDKPFLREELARRENEEKWKWFCSPLQKKSEQITKRYGMHIWKNTR